MRGRLAISGLALLAAAAATAACATDHGGAEAAGPPPVVRADDAVRPQEGRDYRLVRTLRDRDARSASGVIESGEVLLTRYTKSYDVEHALLDPRSGRRTRLPDLGGSADVLSATSSTVWFVRPAPGPLRDLVRLDRSTGHRRHFTLPEVPRARHYTVLGLDADTAWFKTGPGYDHDSPDDVWSVRFGRPGSLEHQGRFSTPTLAGGVLAYAVRRTDGGPDSVALREVATGDTVTVALPGGCSVGSRWETILGNGDRVAVDSHCGDHSPTFVVDREDGVVADLRVESDEGVMQVSDRTVSFYWYSYDLATGRLFDVSGRSSLAGTPPAAGPGDRPLMIWPRGNDRHGDPTTVLVVRLADPS
ncbi:hypothetical protein GCM10009844_02290 [Nocardioides koreensis]|uniref:Uncharacterized protein n=1 Tax=Nocardioides koreensis TaxID=433651 RepID=A0ABN2Z3H5_9ACTN